MRIRILRTLRLSIPDDQRPAWLHAWRDINAGTVWECPNDDALALRMIENGEAERIDAPPQTGRNA